MFDFGSLFRDVLASLQGGVVSVIVQFVNTLLGDLLGGLLPGA